MPWLRSSANKVQTKVFCCCLIDYGIARVIQLSALSCGVRPCTRLQPLQFTVTGIPFCFSDFLISFASDLKL